MKRPFQTIYKPIIAAVNGICMAGGDIPAFELQRFGDELAARGPRRVNVRMVRQVAVLDPGKA